MSDENDVMKQDEESAQNLDPDRELSDEELQNAAGGAVFPSSPSAITGGTSLAPKLALPDLDAGGH